MKNPIKNGWFGVFSPYFWKHLIGGQESSSFTQPSFLQIPRSTQFQTEKKTQNLQENFPSIREKKTDPTTWSLTAKVSSPLKSVSSEKAAGSVCLPTNHPFSGAFAVTLQGWSSKKSPSSSLQPRWLKWNFRELIQGALEKTCNGTRRPKKMILMFFWDGEKAVKKGWLEKKIP